MTGDASEREDAPAVVEGLIDLARSGPEGVRGTAAYSLSVVGANAAFAIIRAAHAEAADEAVRSLLSKAIEAIETRRRPPPCSLPRRLPSQAGTRRSTMKPIRQIACILLIAAAAAEAQSVPYRSAGGSKTVGFVGDHASATATFSGGLGGGTMLVRSRLAAAPTEKLVAYASARASADVGVFDKKLRVAGLDAGARSESGAEGATASAWAELTVCDYTLKKAAVDGKIDLPWDSRQLIIFKAQHTFTFFGIPITVKGEFGGGMDYSMYLRVWGVGDFVKKGTAPMGVSLHGVSGVYALLSVKIEVSIGIGGAGVGGDGRIMSTSLDMGLGATSYGPLGSLDLTVVPLRLRIYVYAWIDLPFRDRDEARRYLADLSIGGATYNLFTIS